MEEERQRTEEGGTLQDHLLASGGRQKEKRVMKVGEVQVSVLF